MDSSNGGSIHNHHHQSLAQSRHTHGDSSHSNDLGPQLPSQVGPAATTSTSTTTSTTRKNRPRACDQCHSRRIRCVGNDIPCESCKKSELVCTFEKIPKKKGPRGTILTKLKEQSTGTATQQQQQHQQQHQGQSTTGQAQGTLSSKLPSTSDQPPILSHHILSQQHPHHNHTHHHHLLSGQPSHHYSDSGPKFSHFSPDTPFTHLPPPPHPPPPPHSSHSNGSPPVSHSNGGPHFPGTNHHPGSSHYPQSSQASGHSPASLPSLPHSVTSHHSFPSPPVVSMGPPATTTTPNPPSLALPQMGQQRAPVADHFQLNGYLDTNTMPTPPQAGTHASPGSLSAVSADSFIHSTLSSYFLGTSDLTNTMSLDLPALTATPARHPMLSWLAIITRTLIRPQIDVFYAKLHPILPLIPRAYIQAGLDSARHLQDPAFAALLLVMTSKALVGPVGASSHIAENQEMAVYLLQECMRVKGLATEFEPTLDSIWTAFFLFAARFNLEQHHEAWFRLREALTLAETMELHKKERYEHISQDECSRRIRTLWVLLVTERAYAMQKNHSITFTTSRISWSLSDLPWLQAQSLDLPPLLGLRCLAHLYSFIDEEIISCWNGKCLEGVCETLDAEQVVALQRGLGAWAEGITDARLAQLSEANRFDLLLSQQWLRNRIWQLTVSHCLSSTDAREIELQPSYSLLIAHETVRVCHKFTREPLEANGVGVAHKLHDIVLSVIYANRILGDAPAEPWMRNLAMMGGGTGGGNATTTTTTTTTIGGNTATTTTTTTPRQLGAYLRQELTQILREFRGGRHPFLQPVLEMN